MSRTRSRLSMNPMIQPNPSQAAGSMEYSWSMTLTSQSQAAKGCCVDRPHGDTVR